MEEFDVVVIGSGPGGYVSAIRCSQLGLKTACIEKGNTLGGTCLNVGCIPSKALLHSSELYEKMEKEANNYGISFDNLSLDFSKMMDHKNKIVDSFTKGIDFLFKKNKIQRILGAATLKDPNTISVNSDTIKAKHIILATGSEPIELPFLPFDEKKIVSSTGALSLETLPKKLLVVGAGIIGTELGSVYRRLGVEVEYIEFLDRICPGLDLTMSQSLQKALEKQGHKFNLSHKVVSKDVKGDKITLTAETPSGDKKEFEGDVVLVCIGRKPYTNNLGLENLSIQKDKRGFVQVDNCLRTSAPNIFAIGDIVNGPMLAHKASEEGVIVAEFIAGHRAEFNHLTIPNVAYTHPEVGSVGLTEEEAKAHFSIKVGSFPFKANSRARCTAEEEGLVKIIADEKSHTLLGMHIISGHASELICLGGLAMQLQAKVDDLADLCFAHPTLSESIKEAALTITKGAIHM